MTNEKLPRWIFRLLKLFCPDHLLEEIEGDLLQKYHRDAIGLGPGKAKRRLLWNVIRFFRPGILFRNRRSMDLNQFYMIKTYTVLAWRTLTRNKVFSTINILGLSVSITVAMLILQYVRFELSYDTFHKDAENIYRVATKVTLQDEIINHETNTYEGISKALTDEFSDVDAATTIRRIRSDNTFVRYQTNEDLFAPIEEFKAIGGDSNFFDVFSFPLLRGDRTSALSKPLSALVTETFENRYFNGDAVGKMLETDDGEETTQYKITGILKDIPANSHVKYDILFHTPDRRETFWNGKIGFWDWGGQTYVRLNNPSRAKGLEAGLNKLARSRNGLKNNKDDYGQISTFELQPLLSIHLYSHLLYELEINGSHIVVYSLFVLAAIILILAWVNYVNLSTAISEEKVKAIGIRKVVGASRLGLVIQVLTESALFNLLSVVLALLSVHLLLPAFSDFAGIPLDHQALYNGWLLPILLLFILGSTLVAGIYPAIVVSSFSTLRALKAVIATRNNFSLRKGLVVFQFAAATSLVIGTGVAYRQLSFMQSAALGIDIDNVIIVKAMNFDKEKWSDADGGYVVDSAYQHRAQAFKDALRQRSLVSDATSLSHIPGEAPNWGTEFQAKSVDAEKAYRLLAIGIDYDFISTLGVKLLAGRNFSPDFPSDRGNEGRRAVLINEAASKLLGFRTPDEAVQKHISTYWGADYEIIGVVNSFHQLSLKENLEPMYFILQPRALFYYAINVKGENAQEAIAQIKHSWIRYFPDVPFNYFFLDERFNNQYHAEHRFSVMMLLFSGLAIFIACLGLVGLTSYAVVQRSKEIGIRKVLGATVSNVIALFTNDFVKLILIATVVAVPLVYVGATRWLESYAFKVSLAWWMFIVPTVAIVAIAVITVALQTVRVALKNPVESLKCE
jgi:putative ABC transport system permease protein